MEFLTLSFVVLFVTTFALYYARCSKRWQHMVLLLSSVVFAGYYHWFYAAVAMGVTLFTFLMGRWLRRHLDTPKAPVILWSGIVGLVGFWLFTRYFTDTFPLGISFYTFQALAYLIDVYWEEECEDDFWDFSIYMLLFMKFLSGPIERGGNLLPQLKEGKSFDYLKTTRGMKMVAWGCFLKLVVADRIAPAIDIVFGDVYAASGAQLLATTLLYPIHLYADFAGYTCMALGLGRMLGFDLQPNFDRPFVSQSTGELWRRWHISLSFWVRDYIFTPLSASLRSLGNAGIYLSLLVTFVIIGVWHGAGLTFAIYGLIQGVIIVYETAFKQRRKRVAERLGGKVWETVMTVRTYILFALSLLFFRLSSVSEVVHTYTHLFDGIRVGIKEMRLGLTDFHWIVFGIAVVMMFIIEAVGSRHDLIAWSERQKTPVRWLLYVAVVGVIFFYGAFGADNFIYAQF